MRHVSQADALVELLHALSSLEGPEGAGGGGRGGDGAKASPSGGKVGPTACSSLGRGGGGTIVIHSFSNGGALVYEAMLLRLAQQGGVARAVRSRVQAVVFDSSPTKLTLTTAWRALTHTQVVPDPRLFPLRLFLFLH